MDPYRRYRDTDCGRSLSSRSRSGYQTRDVSPGPGHGSGSYGSSSYGSYRSVSPLGSSRFERPYVPPSMTPSRVAERNAPVGLLSFYSRDPYARSQPMRPNLSRYDGERVSSSSGRPGTSSGGYGVIDLSSLGGGYDGYGYDAMYGSSRRESSSRRPSHSSRDSPGSSRDPFGGYAGSSSRGSLADILGGPFGFSRTSSSTHSSRYDSGYERNYSPSSRDRSAASYLDHLDGGAPGGHYHRDRDPYGEYRRY